MIKNPYLIGLTLIYIIEALKLLNDLFSPLFIVNGYTKTRLFFISSQLITIHLLYFVVGFRTIEMSWCHVSLNFLQNVDKVWSFQLQIHFRTSPSLVRNLLVRSVNNTKTKNFKGSSTFFFFHKKVACHANFLLPIITKCQNLCQPK